MAAQAAIFKTPGTGEYRLGKEARSLFDGVRQVLERADEDAMNAIDFVHREHPAVLVHFGHEKRLTRTGG